MAGNHIGCSNILHHWAKLSELHSDGIEPVCLLAVWTVEHRAYSSNDDNVPDSKCGNGEVPVKGPSMASYHDFYYRIFRFQE